MGYRGADLDLRTSRAWSATSTNLMSGFEGTTASGAQEGRGQPGRSGSIWVDDTVLACANHAFDVALGHHAGEVRLEHLLYAMTRIEPAANALEARGVRVASLRRDAAMVVASEIPIGSGGAGTNPRRSPELEEALRLAAAHAARSGRPASVEHVLHVLVDLRGDLPGTELLVRHLPRAARDFWTSPGPMRESSYPAASHFVETPEPERFRAAPAGDYLPAHELHAEPAPAPALSAPEPTPASAASDEVLARVAQAELALSERLAKLEAAISNAPQPATPAELAIIKDRLDVIEEAILARDGDNAIGERLSALVHMLQEERAERTSALSELASEVKALAGALGWEEMEGETQEVPLVERLRNLAADLEQHRIELGASLGDRIAEIEKALAAHGQKVAEAHSAYSDELSEVHDALMKLNNNQHTLAGSLDQWRSGESGEIHLINARIGAVQEDGVRRLQMLERLCADMDALSRSSAQESPRRGFGYWLFGTDDWVKASWLKPRSKPWLRHPAPKK